MSSKGNYYVKKGYVRVGYTINGVEEFGNLDPKIKTQRQISQDSIEPYTGNKPVQKRESKRADQIKRDDKVKDITIGLKDIDDSIMYYFNNVIKPTVKQNGRKLNVPVLYGSPERWHSVQKDGFYRDKNGKIQAPLIMFKRTNVEKNRSLGNKLDANNPHNIIFHKNNFNKRNAFHDFGLIENRGPSDEYYAVVMPDYVTLTYNCILFTEYVEQMNKLIEGINFASDSYWGRPEKFKFRAMIDDYDTRTELVDGEDRAVKTEFSITMNGYIVPEEINSELSYKDKVYSKSRVTFKTETVGNIEELNAKSKSMIKDDPNRFYDSVGGSTGVSSESGLTSEEIGYIDINNTFIADSLNQNKATFIGKSFVKPPKNFPSINKNDFTIYINGRVVPTAHVLNVVEDGSDVVVTINTPAFYEETGAVFTSRDQVIISGKIE